MKILVLLSRVPWPLEKGDKLRAFHQIRLLSLKHEIILCCLNDTRLHPEALKKLSPYCAEIIIIPLGRLSLFWKIFSGFFSSKPFQVSYFYHKKAQKIIDRLIEKHLPKHIYCQLIRVAEYAKKYSIIPKTIDYMDAFSTGMVRRAENSPFYLKPIFLTEAFRLKNYENSIFPTFDNRTIISNQDRNLISHINKETMVVIPNGVDTDYFKPIGNTKDYDLVFTGNMNYAPNVESAVYLIKEILPLLMKKFKDIKVLISGISPDRKVKMLASKNVTVTGWVEDMRVSYGRSKIFIAPMKTGTGLQNKLLEAMAMGLPCITSVLVNNALGAIPDEEILIADSAQQYALKVEKLLTDNFLSSKIAGKGHLFVQKNYNWHATVSRLNSVLENRN